MRIGSVKGKFEIIYREKWVGLRLYIFTSLLFTGFIMFFDLLIIRFLFKAKFSNQIYLITGIIASILLILIFALLG